MGSSDKPIMRYSTSEMAKDAIELIDLVGWKSRRELHVIGVSMGGMIAQELVGFVGHTYRQVRYLLKICVGPLDS